MKRRETRGVYEDRLSGRVPDPKRLSAVSRSPLVRAGARRLTFARGLSRVRSVGTADPLAFIESLYGGKFKAVEGGAFPLDKVYRTAGGGLFVSETRLSVSVHPRFDLRLLNVAGGRVGSRAAASSRARRSEARHITNGNVAAPSPKVQTWSVLPPGGERLSPTFSYVTVRGQRGQKAEAVESTRRAARIERLVRDVVSASTPAETPRPTVAPASLRLTSLDLRHFVTHRLRQEFAGLPLNTYLPAAASREFLSVRAAGWSSAASARGATVQGVAEGRLASTAIVAERWPAAWTYAGPSPRRTRGGGVEARNEFHSFVTAKGHAAGQHTAALDPRPPFLQVLPPDSLLSSLSKTFLTLSTAAARQTTYQTGGQVPAPSFQLLRAHTARSVTSEAFTAVDAPRPSAQTPRLQATVKREALASFNTLVERLRPNVTGVAHAGGSTSFTLRVFGTTPRRAFGQASTRRHATSSHAPNQTTYINLFGQSVEFLRPATFAEFAREALSPDAGALLLHGHAPGAAALLFATRLLGRTANVSNVVAPSPTAPAAMRLMKAKGTGHTVRETRAARPEGMALELIRHRREQVLQLPRPGYVFTQPARAQLEERQVITKAGREEIVEVVRKEVRSLASGTNVAAAPSRVELAGLADEVYSTLVRRLMVEKERLGRF